MSLETTKPAVPVKDKTSNIYEIRKHRDSDTNAIVAAFDQVDENFETVTQEMLLLSENVEKLEPLDPQAENLRMITLYEDAEANEERTMIRKLDFGVDFVDPSQNVHLIPSFADEGKLSSIHPGTNDAVWEVNTDAGLELQRKKGGNYGKLVSVAADYPRRKFNPVTGVFEGIIVEGGMRYGAKFSNALDNAAWTTNGEGLTVTITAFPCPVQGEFFWELKETATTDAHRIEQRPTGNEVNGYAGWWLSCFIRKTGNTQWVRLEHQTNLDARHVFNTATGEFHEAFVTNGADFVRTEVEDWGDCWRIGVLGAGDSASNSRQRVDLHQADSTSTSDYAGNTSKLVYVACVNLIGVNDLDEAMPIPYTLGDAQVTRAADLITLSDWKDKGYMGLGQGQVLTTKGTDIIKQEWVDGDLITSINNEVDSTITQAIPTDYNIIPGIIKEVKIKKISDDAPDVPEESLGVQGWALYYNSGAGVDGGGAGAFVEFEDYNELWDDLRATASPKNYLYTGPSNVELENPAYISEGYLQYKTNNRANKTVKGSNGQKLSGAVMRMQGSENLIFENLELTRSPNDLIRIMDSQGIILKNLILDGGAYYDEELGIWVYPTADGNLDITHESDLITIMDSIIRNGNKAHLVSDSDTSFDDRGKLRITCIGCLFENNTQRQPLIRFGKYDLVNFYMTCPDREGRGAAKGIGPATESQILARNGMFEDMRRVAETSVASPGQIWFDNVLRVGIANADTVPASPSRLWTYPTLNGDAYDIPVLLSPADAKAYVLANAGTYSEIV